MPVLYRRRMHVFASCFLSKTAPRVCKSHAYVKYVTATSGRVFSWKDWRLLVRTLAGRPLKLAHHHWAHTCMPPQRRAGETLALSKLGEGNMVLCDALKLHRVMGKQLRNGINHVILRIPVHRSDAHHLTFVVILDVIGKNGCIGQRANVFWTDP